MTSAAGSTVPADDFLPNQPEAWRTDGPYPVGLMGILATVSMLFAAFTAAMLVRRTGNDWSQVHLPAILWANTAVLALSSAAVETARAAVRREASLATARWLALAGLLGALFLAGQILAWKTLVVQDVLLHTGPHAAFFYMLSGVHGLHVIGGLVALQWSSYRAHRGAYSSARHAGLTHTAIYWHFVGAVWAYLLVLLLTL